MGLKRALPKAHTHTLSKGRGLLTTVHTGAGISPSMHLKTVTAWLKVEKHADKSPPTFPTHVINPSSTS